MFAPIPKDFYDADQKFEKCMVCDTNLLQHPKGYFIEKAYKKYVGLEGNHELFAYAICMDCAQKMHQRLSDESRSNVQQYMRSKMEEASFPRDLQQCAITGTPVHELKEYQIQAFCLGDQIISDHSPLLVGESAIDEIAGLLSDKSWEELDGFTDEFFGLPPEFRKAIKDRQFVPL